MSGTTQVDQFYLRLLRLAPFVRRPGGWRFGTRVVADAVIARLVAAGLAVSDGSLVRPAQESIRPWN